MRPAVFRGPLLSYAQPTAVLGHVTETERKQVLDGISVDR
jgi:hypothetical protein